MRSSHCQRQRGFTYLWVLLMLTALSLALLKDNGYRQAIQRQQQEEELFFRGVQIRDAIQQYQKAGNGCFPLGFDDLLRDTRGKKAVYHLRQWFTDPFTGSREWGMSHDKQGRWVGVFSQGKGRPLRSTAFPPALRDFKKADSYQKWVFKVDDAANAPLPSACQSTHGQSHNPAVNR